MTEEVTPQVDVTYYEQGIEILEGQLEQMESIASLDTRAKERIEAALEDLKKKAAAAK